MYDTKVRCQESRTNLAIKNSLISFTTKIFLIVIQFVARSVFIKYLGIELLGVSSTYTSILSTLSLAELGFQSAVVYLLYKPLAEKRYEEINNIINALKVVYRAIAGFILIAALCCIPFLPYILKGVKVNWFIRVIFVVQLSNILATYLLAYKRTLMYADKKGYISVIIDTAFTLSFEIIKIILVVFTSNYIIYVSLTTAQTVFSNVLVHIICRKLYPFLHRTQFDKSIFKSIWGHVKNLFIGKIAYYIYTSTDSLVISSFVSTVSVGFLNNYTIVITSLKGIGTSIVGSVAPIIGNMLASVSDEEHNERILELYTFVRFIVACVFVIPTLILIQDFILWWLGSEYIMTILIAIAYAIDFYIHIVHSALCDFISGKGLFVQDRNISIIGAGCNIGLSILFVIILRNISPEMGVFGVLLGTIISQSVFWIFRSIVVYKHCFSTVKNGVIKYWKINILYILFFALLTLLLINLYGWIPINSVILKFVIGGIMSETIIVVSIFLFFRKTAMFISLKKMVLNPLFKKLFRRKGANS